MRQSKKIEAILSLLVVAALVAYGLFVLRDLREIGPIVPDSLQGSSHAACGEFCWLVIGWLVERGTQMFGSEVRENGCNGPCGGGGGGGFECGAGDFNDNCRRVLSIEGPNPRTIVRIAVPKQEVKQQPREYRQRDPRRNVAHDDLRQHGPPSPPTPRLIACAE
jgi:hypothetical protein